MRRFLFSLSAVTVAALIGGWGIAIAAAVTLLLSQSVMAFVGRHLSGGFFWGAAIILALGFGFSSVMVVSGFLPRAPIGAMFSPVVFLHQGYGAVLLLAGLTALVQALAGGWNLPVFLGFATPPKPWQGLPLLLLSGALVLLALTGFMGIGTM